MAYSLSFGKNIKKLVQADESQTIVNLIEV